MQSQNINLIRLDSAMIDKHDNNKDVDLKANNNVTGSKKQDFQTLNANRNNLVSYEDTRKICLSRKESFSNGNYKDHGNNYIHNKQ